METLILASDQMDVHHISIQLQSYPLKDALRAASIFCLGPSPWITLRPHSRS